MESDESFCRRRALEEDVAARTASCAIARERHQEMADMYRFRAEMLTPHLSIRPRGSAVPVSVHDDVDLLAD